MRNLGLSIPLQLNVQDAMTIAKEAEQRGFESLWTGENPFSKNGFVMAAAYSLSTSKARIATGIANIYTRNPVLLASSAITLDHLSSGRFMLGLGTSHSHMVESIGEKIERPLARMKETVKVVRRAIRGEKFSHQGEFYRLKNVEMMFKPVKEEIPVFISALGRKMIRLGGEVADGVLLIHNTPNYAKIAVSEIEAAAKKAGRDPRRVEVACWFTTCISKDAATARNVAKKSVAMYGRMPFYNHLYRLSGFEKEADLILGAWNEGRGSEAPSYVTDDMVRSLTVSGTPEDCRAKVDEYRRVGVQTPVLTPYPADGDVKQAVVDVIKAFS